MGFETLLEKKRLIVVCGLGGVGKTTLSASLALKAAQMGQKSLVITVDPAKRLATALGITLPCPDPKKIFQKNKGELHACLLDAKETFDQLIRQYAPEHLRETILDNKLYRHLSMMLAGTQEYMAMEKLFALSEQKRFDILIVDTPPARHAIDFLKAPTKLTNMLNDSILKMLIHPSLKLGALGSRMMEALGGLAGPGILTDIAHLMRLSIGLLDGFTHRSESIQTVLTAKSTAFILTTSAAGATLSDALHFRQELASLGFELEGIVINRMPKLNNPPGEIEEALAWGHGQKESVWQTAVRLLEERQTVVRQIEAKLKPLLLTTPHHGFVPEIPEGVAAFDDLKKIAGYL